MLELPWFFALVAAGDEEAGDEDDDRRIDETATGTVTIQNKDPCSWEYLAVDLTLTNIQYLTFFLQVIVRSTHVDIKLQRSQDLVFVYSDILSQLLHFFLIEGLSAIGSKVHYIVEAIAECFEATIYILKLRSE